MVRFQRKFNQLINVLLLIGVVVLLFSSSLRTSAASTLQNWLLKTGLLDAEVTKYEGLGVVNEPWALAQLDGTPLDSAALEGKLIFLHVWATWCPPCIAELPDIQQLVQSVSSEDVTFLLVSVDKEGGTVQQFLEENQYTLPVYRLSEKLPSSVQYNVIPTTFVIDPSGQIIYKHEGLAQYNHEEFKQFLLKNSSTPAKLETQ